jgi:hypothetical protein
MGLKRHSSTRGPAAAPAMGSNFVIWAVDSDGCVHSLTAMPDELPPVMFCIVPGMMSRRAVARFLTLLGAEIGAPGEFH